MRTSVPKQQGEVQAHLRHYVHWWDRAWWQHHTDSCGRRKIFSSSSSLPTSNFHSFLLPRHFKLNEHGVLFAPQETNKYHCYHDSKWMVWMPSYPQNRQRHWQLWTEKMVSRTKLFILSFNNCQNFCSSAGLNSMFLTPGFVERPVLMWDDVPRTLNWLATLQISLIKASTTEMVWIFWARIDF